MLFLSTCLFCGVLSTAAFVGEVLHKQMNDPELVYYFQTTNSSEIPEYEVVYLPKFAANPSNVFSYNFEVFGTPVSLRLRKNEDLVSSRFKARLVRGDLHTTLPQEPKRCHFIHESGDTVAAMSSCEPGSMQGLVFLEDSTLEIHPLTPRLRHLIREPLLEDGDDSATPHIVKRSSFIMPPNDDIPVIMDFPMREAASDKLPSRLTVEIAMFFDEVAYKIFSPFLGDDLKLMDMLLAYMNGVQALYHHPSLGTTIELVLVRLDIMKEQPSLMPHYDGERSKLLDSFCDYQNTLNTLNDEDPNHWDMAVYISGLDFYTYENGRKNGATMGLATVGGVCLEKYNCLIAELGTTNVFGKPYPSAGFTSVYILAHEIGHNLGMHHDSVGNSCPKEGYVMSPSRGTNGETQWSSCSAEVVSRLGWAKCLFDSGKPGKNLDHSRFLDNPGQSYTAKRQCEILLRDKDAFVAPNQELSTVCYNLRCKTPYRSGYYFAGPALDGTKCGDEKYCYGGGCVKKSPPRPTKVVLGGWGPWKISSCKSACIEKSRGFQTKKRECNNPRPINTDRECEGSSVEFGTCKDEKICKSKRRSAVDYASEKCQEFSKLLPELDASGGGLQAPHEQDRIWMGCAIFCRRARSGGFYTPRIELNDLGVSPYFPDGTWCHRENDLNYYCLNHHCLPENFQFTKLDSLDVFGDFPFSQNAKPENSIPPEIKSYFSLNSQGKPVKTSLGPHVITKSEDEDWESDDYVIVPGLKDKLGYF